MSNHEMNSASNPAERGDKVIMIERVALSQLNEESRDLQRDVFGKSGLVIDIADSHMADHNQPEVQYRADGEGYDYRAGSPLFSVVTGGSKPETQITYTVVAEVAEQGRTGELHVVGNNFEGEQVDFAVLGTPEDTQQGKNVFLGREHRGGVKTTEKADNIPGEVSRKAVSLFAVHDPTHHNTIIAVEDMSLNGTQVRGVNYKETTTLKEQVHVRKSLIGKLVAKRSAKIS